MLDFTCKVISIEMVLRCAFGLSAAEVSFLRQIPKNKKVTALELSHDCKKDITRVQRMLKKLTERQLVIRTQTNLAGGGYEFEYAAISREALKEKMEDNFKRFRQSVHTALERF